MDKGDKVFQYDYVERREVSGIVAGDRWVYSASRGNEILLVDVEWDTGVTTSHSINDFSKVAGRDGYLLAGF